MRAPCGLGLGKSRHWTVLIPWMEKKSGVTWRWTTIPPVGEPVLGARPSTCRVEDIWVIMRPSGGAASTTATTCTPRTWRRRSSSAVRVAFAVQVDFGDESWGGANTEWLELDDQTLQERGGEDQAVR